MASEISALLHAAAFRMESSRQIFDKTSPAAYALLLRCAADGIDELPRMPPWLERQLFALLDVSEMN